MYSITTKLNSTFGTTGKATADKMIAKVVGKLKLSREEWSWTWYHAAKYVCEILNIFSFKIGFFLILNQNFIGIELPLPFLSFGCLYLGI